MLTNDSVVHDDGDLGNGRTPAGEVDAGHATFDERENSASVVARPMIGIDQLVAHSGNVRRDLAITSEFVESFADGGLVPFWITPNGDGRYRVGDASEGTAAPYRSLPDAATMAGSSVLEPTRT